MANSNENKPARSFAPGTFEHTRQNIGPLDPNEAKEMVKKLGGEVLPERSAPFDESKLPNKKRQTVIKASGVSAKEVASRANAASSAKSNADSSVGGKTRLDDDLPSVDAKTLKLMNSLMMSDEYQLKPDYGVFNFIFLMSSKNKEKVTKKFGAYTTKKYVEHIQAFVSTIKLMIQISPEAYLTQISNEPDLKFKFLRQVSKWNVQEIQKHATNAQDEAAELTIPMLKPFVKSVYRELLTVYYVGEQQVSNLIKDVYADLSAFPKIDKVRTQNLAKQAVTEWAYLYNDVIKGMYPLLMRICSTEYVEFPRFFTQKINQILQFTGLSKFDLLIPEKKRREAAEKIEEKKEQEKKEAEKPIHVAGERDEIVEAGLKILEQLFPKAGFSNLESHPDMYPYFQPLYRFDDGFNMLNPENGVQVAIVLVRIIDDLFHGCRNIQFNIEDAVGAADTLSDVISEWSVYIEDLFNKKYGDYLRGFMNSLYSQADYPSTQYGKENINNILWRQKTYFLPNFKFSAPTLTKPRNDSKYKPLYNRTDFARVVLTSFVRRIDDAFAAKGIVPGIDNPWEHYRFDISNVVSKRLDVLLGAKRDISVTAATNANLLKYTLCVLSVLDWWINNTESPAYTTDAMHFYRVSAQDGTPEFSVPVRKDQNQLFAESVKKAAATKSQAAAKK